MPEQDKVKLLLKPTIRFMRAANQLVDAANNRAMFAPGTRGLARANETYAKRDAEYGAAYAALDVIVEELQ